MAIAAASVGSKVGQSQRGDTAVNLFQTYAIFGVASWLGIGRDAVDAAPPLR